MPLAPAGFALATASAKARDVLDELAVVERGLADAGMDDAGLLDAELDRAALGGLDGAGDVHRHRADLRVRHQAARAEHLTETADERHHVGRRDAAVEVDRAAVDRLDEILGADDVGAGRLRLVGLGAAGEHRDAHRAAGAVRQVADAAHHLVGVARIDAEVHRDLDGLVELRLGALLDQLHRVVERIELGAVDALAGGADALSFVCHRALPHATSRPIERAEPSIMAIAASTRVAVEIGHLLLGDLAHLSRGDACRRGRPAGRLRALVDASAAFLRK